MTDTITVRVIRSMFGHGREIYRRGDTLEVGRTVLEKHPNTLEQVDQANTEVSAADEAKDSAEADDGVTVDELDPHPEALNVDELEERIADVDDLELLETIREAEAESQNRTTAKDAIDARLNELED